MYYNEHVYLPKAADNKSGKDTYVQMHNNSNYQ